MSCVEISGVEPESYLAPTWGFPSSRNLLSPFVVPVSPHPAVTTGGTTSVTTGYAPVLPWLRVAVRPYRIHPCEAIDGAAYLGHPTAGAHLCLLQIPLAGGVLGPLVGDVSKRVRRFSPSICLG